jgi:hypothetical protein
LSDLRRAGAERHTPTNPVVIGPTSARRPPATALDAIIRSEYMWSPISPSLTFANRWAAPDRSVRLASP